jgi:hypothetical protein
MRQTVTTTGDQLTNALHTLGVHFLMGGQNNDESLHLQPIRLIAALAESKEARLRLALIPLFLEHPEFTGYVRAAAQNLPRLAQLTLQFYYSAAVWLGQIHQPQKPSLPDHFSRELGISITNNPQTNLIVMARRHQELSHAQVNWLGTYEHAARIWLKGLEIERG